MGRRIQITITVLVLVLLTAFTIFVNCEKETSTQLESFSPIETDATLLKATDNQLQKVMRIQNMHTKRLMEIDGVVGTATGINQDGSTVIKIYAERDGVPDLPALLDGVPVEVEVTGMFVAYADPTARFTRPVPIGVSTGHPDITAGTIGCRVKNAQGQVFALSNNHVYANSNAASIGDNELQPGPYDGGVNPADAIGTLYDFQTIDFNGSNNYIDAAIASTTTDLVGYATPTGDGYGVPNVTTVSAYVGQTVQKYGRTTGWTHGTVSELNVTVDVCYAQRGLKCTKLARFVNQIGITPGTFSDGGDSGSLIVTDNANKNPVALLFAGSSTRTLANPINAVLQRFGVTIDNGSGGSTNVPPTANFTYTTTDLTATFTDQSTDSDGSVVAWGWTFGDGATSALKNPTHTYTVAGTYNVGLTVTDDDGATGSISKSVTVTTSTGDEIVLTATGRKVRAQRYVDLSWTGAIRSTVDVYRNNTKLVTTENDGFYTDAIARGTYTYKIFDGTNWSNTVTITM